MKRILLLVIIFSLVVLEGFGQDVYFSVPAGGNWNTAATWGTEPFGAGGAGIPGPSDIAIILGDGAGGGAVAVNTNVTVGDLYIQYDNDNLLTKGGFFTSSFILTINGQLGGVDFIGIGDFASPITNVITSNNRLTLVFTGLNVEIGTSFNPVITSWSHVAPFPNLRFNLANPNFEVQIEDVAILGLANRIEAGNVRISQGFSLIDNGSNARLTVNEGANLIVEGAINGNGNNDSKIGDIVINGNCTTGSSGYINSQGFTLGSTGNFTVNFIGTNQQSGWWFGGGINAPNAPIINIGSTFNFRANSNQNIPAITFGNLRLEAPFVAANKNLQSGSLNVQGNLFLESSNVTFNTSGSTSGIQIGGNVTNNGTWNPTQLVRFNGTTAQTITGGNPITFSGGVRFENTLATVSLLNQNMTVENEIDIDPGATFNPDDRNVNLNGNLVNDGTLVAGTTNSLFSINGITEISGVGLTNFRNLTISAAGDLMAPFEGDFTVRSNFTNNGTFDSNSGTVIFSGSLPKRIQGSNLIAFHNLNVTNSANLTVQGNADLHNILTLDNGVTFDADGTGSGVFTLKSTALRDAAIGNIGTAIVSGNFTIERWIERRDPTLNRGYHIVGFPATGVTVADIQNELPINGNFSGASGYSVGGIKPNNPSLYRYVENVNGSFTQQQRYVAFPPSTNTTPFTAGEGYHLFTFTGLAPTTINGRGALFRGDFSRSLTYTGSDPDAGWHTIANPYPAPTDWSQWTKTNIEGSTAYLFDPQNGQYIALDGSSQQLISQGQGVFVRVNNGGGSVAATESTKVTGVTPTYYREQNKQLERFEIILRKDTIEDISIVSLVDGATEAYEPEFDATRLLNIKETLSTLSSDGRALKVNRIGKQIANTSCSRSILLNMEQMVTDVEYFIEFRDLEYVSNYQFVLVDHYLDLTIPVNSQSSISFNVNENPMSKGGERFELVLEGKEPNQINLTGGSVCPEQDGILYFGNTQPDILYKIYKDGSILSTFLGTGEAHNIQIDNQYLFTGENLVNVYAANGGCDSVNIGSEIIHLVEPLIFDNLVSGSMICKEETFATFEVDTQAGSNYYVLQSNDTLVSFEGSGEPYSGQIATSYLSEGINTLRIGVEKDECQSGILEQELIITVDALNIDQTVNYYGNSTCDKSKGEVVINTQNHITYEIFKGTQLVASVLGTGEEIKTSINESLLNEGINEFKIFAKYGSCSTYEFTEMAQITVNLLDAPQINLSGNILESSIEADVYTWFFNGKIIDNETSKIIVARKAGVYSLKISMGDCSLSSSSVEITETILSSNDAIAKAVTIYPNPVSDILRISVKDVNEVKVTIFTVSGQFVTKYLLKGYENEVDLSKLSKGTYLIQLNTDKGTTTKRIVKN